MKAIAIEKNQAGKRYAICRARAGAGYVVWGESENYRAGRMVRRWGYVAPRRRMTFIDEQTYALEGISIDEARALFNKKIAGRAK